MGVKLEAIGPFTRVEVAIRLGISPGHVNALSSRFKRRKLETRHFDPDFREKIQRAGIDGWYIVRLARNRYVIAQLEGVSRAILAEGVQAVADRLEVSWFVVTAFLRGEMAAGSKVLAELIRGAGFELETEE